MGNCLVTQLKDVVNNPDLKRLDYFSFSTVNDPYVDPWVTIRTEGTINLYKDGVFLQNVPSLTQVMLDKGHNFMIGPETSLFRLALSSGNTFDNNQIKYLPGSFTNLGIPLGNAILNNLPSVANLSYFTIYAIENLTEEVKTYIVSYFKNKPLKEISIFNRKDSIPLFTAYQIAEMISNECVSGIYGEGLINGTIEDFVRSFRERAIPKTEGTFTWNSGMYNRALTFKGEAIPTPSSGDSIEISWTATTITCNGVTITA